MEEKRKKQFYVPTETEVGKLVSMVEDQYGEALKKLAAGTEEKDAGFDDGTE